MDSEQRAGMAMSEIIRGCERVRVHRASPDWLKAELEISGYVKARDDGDFVVYRINRPTPSTSGAGSTWRSQ